MLSYRLKGHLLITMAALALYGCGPTLTYRDIQGDFNAAVQADNVQSVDTLVTIPNSSQLLFERVLERLTEEFIQSLDPKLRPNAYTLRAVAEWRSGRLAEARQTAETTLALQDAALGPRDEIVLRLIPALVEEQDLLTRYRRLPEPGYLKEVDYLNGTRSRGRQEISCASISVKLKRYDR